MTMGLFSLDMLFSQYRLNDILKGSFTSFFLLFIHVNAHNQDEISLFHMVTSKLMVYFENVQVEEMLNSECTKWTNGLIALQKPFSECNGFMPGTQERSQIT